MGYLVAVLPFASLIIVLRIAVELFFMAISHAGTHEFSKVLTRRPVVRDSGVYFGVESPGRPDVLIVAQNFPLAISALVYSRTHP